MADQAPYPSVSDTTVRNRTGWIYLTLIFAALITLQGISYFGRKTREPLKEQEAQLKVAVTTRALTSKDGLPSIDPISTVIASLDKLRAKNDDAERLWVIATYEDGKPLPPSDLARLKAANVVDGPQLAKLYGSPKLSPAGAKAIVKTLEDQRFSTRLARIHAQEKGGLPSGRRSLASSSALAALFTLVLLTFLGLCLWAAFLVALNQGAIRFAGHPAEPLSTKQSDLFAMRVAQLLAAYVLLPIGFALLIPKSLNLDLPFLSEVGILIATFALFNVPLEGEFISLRRIGFRADRLGKDILLGVAACVMNLPLVLGLGYLGQWIFRGLPEAEHPISVQLEGHPGVLAILGLLFAASVVAPLFEEILFRGTFLPAVAKATRSPLWGAVITSLLFATIHPTGVPAWPSLAAIGGMSCLLVYQTRSLVPSIVMHGVHNALFLWIGLAAGG